MEEEDKKTKFFFLILFVVVAISMGFGYWRIMVEKDIMVFTTEDQLPPSYLPF